MIRTVDLVIAGGGNRAFTAAAAALQDSRRILVLLRSSDPRVGQRFRRRLHNAVHVSRGQVTVATNAEAVCVDGVNGVEVVVIRHVRTGHLRAVNASAFLACDGSTSPGRGDGHA